MFFCLTVRQSFYVNLKISIYNQHNRQGRQNIQSGRKLDTIRSTRHGVILTILQPDSVSVYFSGRLSPCEWERACSRERWDWDSVICPPSTWWILAVSESQVQVYSSHWSLRSRFEEIVSWGSIQCDALYRFILVYTGYYSKL